MDRGLIGRLVPGSALRIAVSFVLALLLWGWVTTQRDPSEARTIDDLPVPVPALADDLMVVGELGTVDVRVEGPRSQVEDLVADDLEIRLDTGQIEEPNTYPLEVEVDAPGAVDVVRVTPPSVNLLVDERVSRSFRVEPIPPELEGDNREVGEIAVDPSDVTVGGPSTFVNRVARVVAPIEIGDRTETFSATVQLEARDAEGQPITGVTILPEAVTSTVPVDTRGKSVPVLAQTSGNPAEGYEVVDRRVNPAMVLLDGPDEALAEVFSASTEEVDIQGVTGNVSKLVALEGLPPDVHVLDPPSGQVAVVIQISQRGVQQDLPPQRVAVSGLGPGLTAAVEPAELVVTVVAGEEALAGLRAGDVEPRVDLTGRGPGSYVLTPTVAVPRGVQWIRTNPAQVRVTVRAAEGTPPADQGPPPPASTVPPTPTRMPRP
jgi:YbbR domain-containing protein